MVFFSKETLKTLKAEKREVENMAEGMKDKLYQAYQQKGAEQSDVEARVLAARTEGHNQGEQHGFRQGKIEGLGQVIAKSLFSEAPKFHYYWTAK